MCLRPLIPCAAAFQLNCRMILVSDGVAEVSRETHDAELRTMSRLFADVRTTEEVEGLLILLSHKMQHRVFV